MSLFASKIPTIVIDVKHVASNHRGELFGMSWKFQENRKRIMIHFQSGSGMYWQITYCRSVVPGDAGGAIYTPQILADQLNSPTYVFQPEGGSYDWKELHNDVVTNW